MKKVKKRKPLQPPRRRALKARPRPSAAAVPAAGLMILFPSYFYHRTIPFEDPGTRVSIAFDLMPA